METVHEPLLVLDGGFHVRLANPSFCRAFDVSEEDALGRSLFDLGDGHWRVPELRTALEQVVEADESFQGLELDRRFPGLGRRVVRLNGHTLRSDGSESGHVLLLAIEDITEERELDHRLREHARRLERSNADLEQFAYAASHDLQEPLRMISSYLELLERRYADDLDDDAREFIDYAVDGAERMKDLIDGLLQYSRVGRKEGALGDVDLAEVASDVRDDLSRRVEEVGGEVVVDDLPTVHGSRGQFHRLLQNLIENALTYHGDAPPRVRVSGTRRGDGSVRVGVADRGPAIPEEHGEKVFQIFQQLDPHGEGRPGSGIGLALCRKIVERHGGRIWVESEPGEGSTFHFTLNLEPGEA